MTLWGVFFICSNEDRCYFVNSPKLARDMPYIFIKHVYACASLAGALLCGLMRPLGEMPAMVAGAALVFVIRCLSAHYRWNLPKIHD